MLRSEIYVFRLFALSFMLLLMPTPILAEIIVIHDLDMKVIESKPLINQDELNKPNGLVNQNVSSANSIRVLGLSKVISSGAPSYKLSAGDAIAIRVFGEDSLNIDIELDGTGIVHYPFLGKLVVSGLSVSSLAHLIVNGLADGYLNDPQVNVSIIKYRSFYISGQVNSPGSFAYVPGMNVGKAVSLAGGLNDLANVADIRIVYEGKDKNEAIKMAFDAEIHPGDTVTIGELGYFYIDGEVNDPGRYVFQPGLTLRKAVAVAGGFTERAARSKISIISDGKSNGKQSIMNDMIQPGDSITVEESLF